MRKTLIAALTGAIFIAPVGPLAALAQTSTTKEPAAAPAVADDAVLTPAELDKLMAPVALYPDTLLSQIMLASTYTLEVVKAARFLDEHADMPEKERAALAEKTDWDPSVQALTAGFPTIVTRMNENIDWTEQLGYAVLVQTDDVLDAVQRLRDEAAGTGYLTTNDAQTVTVNADNTITIAPTDPQVVYVPSYDSNVVYSQPAPPQVVYMNEGTGSNFNDALATGAIVFGSALILNEIFDNNDPWNGYWRGPPQVNWNNGDFNGRPGVDINGDVNVGSGNTINRDGVKIDRSQINLDRNNVNVGNINRDKINVEGNAAARARIGTLDREGIDQARDRSFNPDAARQAEARDKITARKAAGDPVPSLANLGGTGERQRPQAGKPDGVTRPAKVNKPVAVNRPAKVDRPAAVQRPANVSRPSAANLPKAGKGPQHNNAFDTSGGSRAKAAANRGKASVGKRGG